jgi:hypothetical protein
MMKTLTTIFALLILAGTLSAQVIVAPSVVNLSDVEKNGYVTVKNSSNTTPLEISIKIKNETGPSAAEYINIFPDKFVLKPMEEKKVEISVNPDDLLDGEFMGTPEITYRPLGTKTTSENITTAGNGSLSNKTVFNLSYFKRGKSSIKGLDFVNLSANYKNGLFYIISRFKCDNSEDEFDGNLRIKIFDENGNKIKETTEKISINCQYRRDIVVSTDNLSAGVYVVEATFCKDKKGSHSSCEVMSRKICVVTE